MNDYEDMDIEQLEAANAGLMQQRSKLRAEQTKLVAVLEHKRREAAMAADLKKLRERHGVEVQVVKPDGIASAEQVNGG